jgi:hypothetical protein
LVQGQIHKGEAKKNTKRKIAIVTTMLLLPNQVKMANGFYYFLLSIDLHDEQCFEINDGIQIPDFMCFPEV